MNKNRLLLVLLAMVLIISQVAFSACEKEEDGTSAPTISDIYSEAPMLAERVAAGELPPVEERLPVNPVVVQPVERVGVYGGTWRMGILESGDASAFMRTINYENLVKWDPAWTKVVPNVAQSYHVNDDATVFTFQTERRDALVGW